MLAAAPEPESALLERAKRAVRIRLRQKLEKGSQSLRDPLAFARWYLNHLLSHPEEIAELEELERIREEVVAKLERAITPTHKHSPHFDVEAERSKLAREVEEARRRRSL